MKAQLIVAADMKMASGRTYPRDILQKALDTSVGAYVVESVDSHFPLVIDITKIGGTFRSYDIADDGNVTVELEMFTNDMGLKLRAMIEAGAKLDINAIGSIDEDQVVTKIVMIKSFYPTL